MRARALSPAGNERLRENDVSCVRSLVVATLDAATGVSMASPPDPTSIAIPSMLTFSGATTPLTLTVLGFADDASSYRGSVTFNTVAAVPEPETYALLLAGLAGIGLFSRGRKAKAK